MSTRDDRIAVFNDTESFINESKRLTDSVNSSVSRTKVYKTDIDISGFSNAKDGTVSVTKHRTIEAAVKLHEDGKRVAVLNFASATNPGGGVAKGSNAQEESICRCTTLYPCLKTYRLRQEFYDYHRKLHDVRYSDTCIYTPDVIVIKSDTDSPVRLSEKDWVCIDVISCAAPNLRENPYNAMNPGKGEAIKLTQRELLELHKERADRIFKVAAVNNVDNLVLGAFGCGAFQNDPNVVARAYSDMLKVYRGYFDKVEFAAYCGKKDTLNFDVFNRRLGKM